MLANQLDSAAYHLDAHTCSRDRMTPVTGHGPVTCRSATLSDCREPLGSRASADPRLSGPLDEESAVQPRRRPVYPPASSPLSRPRASSPAAPHPPRPSRDRKSTRLNSSHVAISYAVFCLKKKKNINKATETA